MKDTEQIMLDGCTSDCVRNVYTRYQSYALERIANKKNRDYCEVSSLF